MYASCLFSNNDDASFSIPIFMQWSCDVVYYQFPFILLPIISVHFRHKIAVWKLLWHLMSKGVSRCLMLTFKQQNENSGFDGAFCNKYWWIWLNNVEWFLELSANYLRGATPNICQLKPKFSQQPWFSVWLCLCGDYYVSASLLLSSWMLLPLVVKMVLMISRNAWTVHIKIWHTALSIMLNFSWIFGWLYEIYTLVCVT